MNNLLRRHGDVNLIPVDTIPDKAFKEVESLVIAYGEQTGHNHTLTTTEPEARFKVLEHNGERYFVLNKPAKLTHPEHKTITVLPGIYIQGQEREKDWFSLSVRKVID